MSSVVMSRSGSRLPWQAVLAVASPILLAIGLELLPPWLLSEIGIQVLVVFTVLLIALLIALLVGSQTVSDSCWRVSAVLWAFLLCSEQLFPRRGAGNAAAYQGAFSGSAYAEPIL